MVTWACDCSYLGGRDRRIAWTWETEFAVSRDCATVLQTGNRVRLHLKKWKLLGFSRQNGTNKVCMWAFVCMCGESQRLWSRDKSKIICRLEIQERFAVQVQKQPAVWIPFSFREVSLFQPSTDWMRPLDIMQGNLPYINSSDLNINLIQKRESFPNHFMRPTLPWHQSQARTLQ